ncbi:dynein regulatory complex protein 10-like [Anticarsia gemmatalis]|uniref:dynein regulatory complex protein 10-like n=1 Tax=Anticarsia gemmatalis TaxID=129554 RepID=UPI003F759B91
MDAPSSGTLQSPSTYSSSSTKTGSSKSAISMDKEKEMDLTKDNAASPIDLECHIQCERITKILDEAIYKCKLSICLPDLVQEFKTLSSVLSSMHMDDLIFIFDQYDNPLFSASVLNMATMEDLKAGDLSLKNRLNPELGHLLYIMNHYPELKPTVENMITQMKQSQDSKNPSPGMDFLLELEQFRDLMVRQMETTAAEELLVKINTRKLEASNNSLISLINEYTSTLKEESERFEHTMALKAEIITKLEHELSLLNYEATIKLKKKILDSERQMVLATRAHLVKHEMLKEEEVECKESYETLLRMHMIEEKNQRARRFKVETQLLSWLQKYDAEMADKQVELDEFTQKYEDEVQKCEELQIKLDEQNIEYEPLMAEREEEYHQEMTEKMQKFLIEHSARVIQHAWRTVLANRAEKKKLKKQLKKIQAEQAAAEARQAALDRAAEKAAKAAEKAAKKKK